MIEIKYIAPEIFLSISVFSLLTIGVFIKKSFNVVYRLSQLVIFLILLIILSSNFEVKKIFNDSIIIDNFSTFMKSLILISSFFILTISKKYLIDIKNDKFEYPIIILLSILGMFVMVGANDLIVFYLGLELQSLALYILAAIDRDNSRSSEAGIKYFILSALSSGLLLYGCSLLYGFSGSTNFELILENTESINIGTIFAMVFILVGLAFKVSAVPFHMWTPDVYEGAPTSVTSFFSVVPKIAGLAVFIKFMYIPFREILDQWQYILVFISIGSMILGAVAAIGQNNIKRLIAYSSIGHIGYAIAGIAAGTENGFRNTIIYIAIYSVMNIGAFAFVLSMKRGQKYIEDISELSGASKNHPLMCFALLIILFSLAGIPPLAGFFAKFYIFMSVIESGMFALAIIGLVTTVVSAFYYIRVVKIMYFDSSKKPFENYKDIGVQGSLILSCILLISFFLYPSILNDVVSNISIF
ncbi:MAG: NADH-quinone oxidoreductase subunit NuoN [Candidatus Marinimicrobia bacterium]|nr:NADH-quinone oxidoreductase subunit NuoN [Candidatus Neomarinimicrobiota bacterium]RPG05921.1 MAG: NADH-quinone oxidoreductase subunit NuoN [Pelagibacteraceae bacterium TMED247]|tara:strand:- start:617 stop:2029 length:1413 start_codon:yes stop_codon:yes gene_type:complete